MDVKARKRWAEKASLLPFVVFLLLSSFGKAQDFMQSVVQCPNAGDLMGYDSIADMNEDMMRELTQIAGGQAPQTMYTFTLCPNTIFDASNATLTPLLNNAMFICGENGSRNNGCEFRGGTAQVAIEDSLIDAHRLNTVNFVGVTFTGFTGTSIGGGGSSNVTVNLDMVEFSNFDSMFVVQQQNPGNAQPFNVNVQDTRIRDGNGGAAFSNAGGVLSLMNVEFLDNTFLAAVSTGSTGSSTGMTMVAGVSVVSSSIMDIFATMEGSQISATRINIMSMEDMTNVFDVTGTGSMAILDNVTISNNDLGNVSPPPRWVGVNVRDNAMASVTGMSVSASTNIRHIISAQVNGMVDVSNFEASDIIGGRQVNSGDPSGVFYADIGSDLMVTGAEVTNPSFFTGVLFAGGGSNVEMTRSCFFAPAETQVPIYISENSTHSGSENFLEPEFESSQCPDAGMRLGKEDAGSSCFEGTGIPCSVTCMPFFDLEECMRTEVLSESPSAAPSSSAAPTVIQTESPTLTPRNDTDAPTLSPTIGPDLTLPPTDIPVNASDVPSDIPSEMPSDVPSALPSSIPSFLPTSSSAPSATPSVNPSASPSISPAPSTSPTAEPTNPIAPTPSPTRRPFPPTILPDETTQPTLDECIKYGKWVKRDYHVKGKGYQTYYVFDENICAVYRSDDWLMGHNPNPPKQVQYAALGKQDGRRSGKGKGSSKASVKGSGKGYNYGRRPPTGNQILRKKRPPASIWQHREGHSLRRADLD